MLLTKNNKTFHKDIVMKQIKQMIEFLFFLLVGVTTAHVTHAQEHEGHSATAAIVKNAGELGVLIMAHGGNPEWDAGVMETVAPLSEHYNLEVALGMADAYSLQEAVSKLEARGAKDIAVVRLFISGESWYERTQQILGMVPGAPERPESMINHSAHADHADVSHGDTGDVEQAAAHMGHRMEFWQVDSDANFTMSKQGLAEAPQMGDVLLGRAQALSKNPAAEDVLILAHGPESDEEDARWVQYIDERADTVRKAMPFHQVKVATLREDWPEKREAAEQLVKNFVTSSTEAGRITIVIPYRVHGFGPYARVLEDLSYVSDGMGLIPHPAVSIWIQSQIEELRPRN